MNRVTAREALEECLIIIEGRRRAISKNLAGYAPKEGYEKQFEMDTDRMEKIREVLRELEKPVKDWQKIIEEEDAIGRREALRFDEGLPVQTLMFPEELRREMQEPAWEIPGRGGPAE